MENVGSGGNSPSNIDSSSSGNYYVNENNGFNLPSINRSKLLGVFVLLLIVVAIPVTVYISQQQQEIRQRASEISPTPPPTCEVKADVMILIDKSRKPSSGSVFNVSATGTNVQTSDPNSVFLREKEIAKAFVNELKKEGKHKVGIVAFAGDYRDSSLKIISGTSLVSPLNNNYDDAIAKIDGITLNPSNPYYSYNQTNNCVECGIREANKEIAKNSNDGAKKIVILITNGNIKKRTITGLTEGDPAPIYDVVKLSNSMYGTIFYPIARDSGDTSDLNSALLENIKTFSGGIYYSSTPNPDSGISSIYKEIVSRKGTEVSKKPLDVLFVIRNWVDFSGNNTAQFNTAKEAVKSYIDKLKEKGSNNKVGIVSYAFKASVNSKLTTDYEAAKSSLDGIKNPYDFGANCLQCALMKANQELNENKNDGAIKMVVIVSDFASNAIAENNNPDSPVQVQYMSSVDIARNYVVTTINNGYNSHKASFSPVLIPSVLGAAGFGDILKTIENTTGGTSYTLSSVSQVASTLDNFVPTSFNMECPVSPTITISPTDNISPSSSPSATVSPSSTPSASVTPSVSPSPSITILNLTLKLQGIGNVGRENATPAAFPKTVSVQVFNTSNEEKGSKITNMNYNREAGKFTAAVDMGDLPTGEYLIKVKAKKYLMKLIGKDENRIVNHIDTRTVNNITPVTLFVGDINGDNKIGADLRDLNILYSCRGKSLDTSITGGNGLTCADADLNDDGKVDIANDYAWLFENFQIISGD